jgi:succinoglycan biosynthesis protein ExoO
MMCDVSVIMAAYNARAFIAQAIDSVIQQTCTDWELIIVDDCSTDGTIAYVESTYGSMPRIRCYSLERNSGPGAARNFGVQLARGTWVAILDSDDKFSPERLAQLQAVCEAKSLDLVADNQEYFDDRSKTVFQQAFRLAKSFVPLSTELLLQNDGPPLRFSFGALKPFVNRGFLIRNDIAYPEHLRVGEDFAFLFQCLNCGAKAGLLAAGYYIYTVPMIRAKPASGKTRTNYGMGNIESLIEANSSLGKQLISGRDGSTRLASLFELRHRRLSCALALRDIAGLPPHQAVRRLLKETGWRRFFADKLHNVFQRSHSVRGVNP